MLRRSSIGSVAIAVALGAAMAGARAHDEAKYPDWKGQWVRMGGIQWDPSKPLGRAELAPLTPEYQAIFEAGLASQAAGGQGNDPTYTCIPPGMPRAMTVVFPMEIVILPQVTYLLLEYVPMLRRVYTDGRPIATEEEPSFLGYSVGTWLDTDGDGKFDTLEIETRNFKGPRTFDASGIPLHEDGQTVVRERLYLDKTDRAMLRNEVTTIDNALTHPWTVMKTYRRDLSAKPIGLEYVCAEGNHHVVVGKQNYFVSGDGFLMPTRKDQKGPDLKFFNQR